MEYRGTITDNQLTLHGIEQPGGFDTIISSSPTHIAAKRKGHKYCYGNKNYPGGASSYASPEVTVYRIDGTDKFGRYILIPVISWEVKKHGSNH